MSRYHRREFLSDVGRGMLVAGVGSALAIDLGLAPAALGAGSDERLTFGPMEPLVALMQETPAAALLPAVIERMNSGTDLRQLVAAAALANARTFGGQDYDGYHAIMALAPAYQMSRELPESRRALPVMKVLYRNTSHIQQMGGRSHEALHAIEPPASPAGGPGAEALREATRRQDMEGAERTFAALARGPLDETYNKLQYVVQDYIDVHRVVLAWRSWALLDLTGKEHAHTLLRQSLPVEQLRQQTTQLFLGVVLVPMEIPLLVHAEPDRLAQERVRVFLTGQIEQGPRAPGEDNAVDVDKVLHDILELVISLVERPARERGEGCRSR